MADTTLVSYSCNPLAEQLGNLGINIGVGGTVLEYAPRDNVNITYNGTLGWRPVGMSETAINFVFAAEYANLQTGMVAKTQDVKQTSIDLTVDVSIMAATQEGKRMALGYAKQVVILPTTPVSTTVDGDVVLPNDNGFYEVGLTAVTGLNPGDTVGIVTGDATYGTEEEFADILSIDTVLKVIRLKTPIFQLPADGAAVRKVKEIRLFVEACSDMPDRQFRIVKYNRSNRKPVVEHAQDMVISGFSGVTNANDAATTYGFQLRGKANFDIATNTYSLSSYNELKAA